MASSSSSSSSSSSVTTKTSFDVFLSFRGADTRDNFTSHLYGALCREKIQTFIDDNLNRGEEIEPSLMQVIEESEISVVIFSKGYASSPWCLDELMKILECRKTMQRMVLPVFYHVDPSDVEEPSGDFGDAFQKLEEKYKTSMPNWRFALKEATTLSGWDSKNHRPDSTLVEVVVKDVKDILSKMHQMSSTDSGGFVGIESHIEKIESLLSIGPEAVRFVGVWGMGGIGKSTCAELVYHRISNKFDGTCFLANVRENFEKEKDDPIPLLEKVISRILKDEKVKIETPNMLPESIKRRLQRMKVLIVLDDVNEARQMEYLVGNGNWFASGSRIIITSRDEHVLKHKVNELRLYRVGGLSEVDALQLFSLNAFEQKYPLLDYLNLSKRAIRYANGLPLALKVLGSHLCKRSKEQWELALENLPKSRDVQKNILGILEISYEELEKSQKDIFLDIACFFKGKKKDRVESILNGCGLNASWGITRLVEKCLVDIVNNKLQMHDLIQEMGRNVGKRNHSRIHWDSSPEEMLNILAANEGNKTIEGIFLNFSEFRGNKVTLPQAFSGMDDLRILRISTWSDCNVQWDIQCLPNRLSFLDWTAYPCKSLPSNFTGENLVELKMSGSRLERLWNGNEFLRADYTRVVFPGSEVPEQFQCQSAGSSISIKLSPHYNNKAVGFAICAVGERVDMDIVTCDCHVEYDNGNRRKVTYYMSAKDLCETESDHVFICYEWMHFRNVNKLSFKFRLNRGKSKIKMCGVHMTSIVSTDSGDEVGRYNYSAIDEACLATNFEEGEAFLMDYDPSSNAPVISKINREIRQEESQRKRRRISSQMLEGNEKDAALLPSSFSCKNE